MDTIVLNVLHRYICCSSEYHDRIPGGLADKGPPKDLSQAQLEKGIKVEQEHTSDPEIAREIAYDHLTEDPEYYTKLEKIEKKAFDQVAVIRKEKGEFCVRSPDNPDWNGGCYSTKEKAEERLRQVEYFKRKEAAYQFLFNGLKVSASELAIKVALRFSSNPR